MHHGRRNLSKDVSIYLLSFLTFVESKKLSRCSKQWWDITETLAPLTVVDSQVQTRTKIVHQQDWNQQDWYPVNKDGYCAVEFSSKMIKVRRSMRRKIKEKHTVLHSVDIKGRPMLLCNEKWIIVSSKAHPHRNAKSPPVYYLWEYDGEWKSSGSAFFPRRCITHTLYKSTLCFLTCDRSSKWIIITRDLDSGNSQETESQWGPYSVLLVDQVQVTENYLYCVATSDIRREDAMLYRMGRSSGLRTCVHSFAGHPNPQSFHVWDDQLLFILYEAHSMFVEIGSLCNPEASFYRVNVASDALRVMSCGADCFYLETETEMQSWKLQVVRQKKKKLK